MLLNSSDEYDICRRNQVCDKEIITIKVCSVVPYAHMSRFRQKMGNHVQMQKLYR